MTYKAVPRVQPSGWRRTGATATRTVSTRRPPSRCSIPCWPTEELDVVLDAGRAPDHRCGPDPANGRSPADPAWDPFWARVQEADMPVAYHAYGGRDAYDDAFRLLWQRQAVTDGVLPGQPAKALGSATVRCSTPRSRSCWATCSVGSRTLRIAQHRDRAAAWVPYCLHVLDHAGGLLDRHIEAFGETVDERPSEIFRQPLLGVAVPRGGHRRPDRADRCGSGAVRLRLAPCRGHTSARATTSTCLKKLGSRAT